VALVKHLAKSKLFCLFVCLLVGWLIVCLYVGGLVCPSGQQVLEVGSSQ